MSDDGDDFDFLRREVHSRMIQHLQSRWYNSACGAHTGSSLRSLADDRLLARTRFGVPVRIRRHAVPVVQAQCGETTATVTAQLPYTLSVHADAAAKKIAVMYDGETPSAAAQRHCSNTVGALHTGWAQDDCLTRTEGLFMKELCDARSHVGMYDDAESRAHTMYYPGATFNHGKYVFVCPGETAQAAAARFCGPELGLSREADSCSHLQCEISVGAAIALQIDRQRTVIKAPPAFPAAIRSAGHIAADATVNTSISWDVVISRCREPLDWLTNFSSAVPPEVQLLSIFVYEKCGSARRGNPALHCARRSKCSLQFETLPNVGFETMTYAHFMVKRYGSFADSTTFFQGDPFDHVNSENWRVDILHLLRFVHIDLFLHIPGAH